jgi:DNA-3-methyladenine glycosylase II
MASFSFRLEPVPPFRLDLTAWALRRRPENLIDRWNGESYTRIILQRNTPLEVAVTSTGTVDAPGLEVLVQDSRASSRVESEVRRMLTIMLGTNADLSGFYRMAERSKKLKLLASQFRGLKPPRFPTVFEALVNAIACQQLSLTVGITVLNRLSGACGSTGGSGNHAFPTPSDVLRMGLEDMRRLGFSYAKAGALLELARAVATGEIDLEGLSELDDDAVRQTLLRIKGVGRWTAEYAMLRGLGRLSIFPGDDVGAKKGLRKWLGITNASEEMTYERVNGLLSRWKPFAGLIYIHLLLSGLAEKGLVIP